MAAGAMASREGCGGDAGTGNRRTFLAGPLRRSTVRAPDDAGSTRSPADPEPTGD